MGLQSRREGWECHSSRAYKSGLSQPGHQPYKSGGGLGSKEPRQRLKHVQKVIILLYIFHTGFQSGCFCVIGMQFCGQRQSFAKGRLGGEDGSWARWQEKCEIHPVDERGQGYCASEIGSLKYSWAPEAIWWCSTLSPSLKEGEPPTCVLQVRLICTWEFLYLTAKHTLFYALQPQ